MKFQIRVYSRFENFTNQLVVRSPRSGGTRSGCNPRERCGERSGADFATTEKVLPKKRAFDNRDSERSTSRSKNFSLFQTYKYSLEKGKFFATILPKRSKNTFNPAFLAILCACCTTQIYKNLYKNWIFRKFKYARKEEFYATIICFGQFIRPSSRG